MNKWHVFVDIILQVKWRDIRELARNLQFKLLKSVATMHCKNAPNLRQTMSNCQPRTNNFVMKSQNSGQDWMNVEMRVRMCRIT